jgi:hypothetical protein
MSNRSRAPRSCARPMPEKKTQIQLVYHSLDPHINDYAPVAFSAVVVSFSAPMAIWHRRGDRGIRWRRRDNPCEEC